MKIILASASLRRQELLKRIVNNFDILVSSFNEDEVEFKDNPSSYVIELAKGKAHNVANTIKEEAIVIGCDTVVTIEGKALGKPIDEKDAEKMLKYLSGKCHQVYSGVAVINTKTKEVFTTAVCTDVKFSLLTEEDIRWYINTKEPFDKAGAYGIQGFGGVFVEEIHGCYYNVVGLPLNILRNILREMGVNS